MNIHFGEAFKLRYERLKGPSRGERHLPPDDFERQLKEWELERQAGDRLALNVEVLAQRPAQLVFTHEGNYLLTDGPEQNSLNAYKQIASTLPPANNFEETFLREQTLTEQLKQAGVLGNAEELNVQYAVGKHAKSGFVFPLVKNMNSLISTLTPKLRKDNDEFSVPAASGSSR